MNIMGAAEVDLSYHGYRSSGSDAPAPTQATLHMRGGRLPRAYARMRAVWGIECTQGWTDARGCTGQGALGPHPL